VRLLGEQGADDVLVTVGGTIPAGGHPRAQEARTQDIIEFIRNSVGART
jgi:methylmalonyl-CoA mutase cobalamin-binding subunit